LRVYKGVSTCDESKTKSLAQNGDASGTTVTGVCPNNVKVVFERKVGGQKVLWRRLDGIEGGGRGGKSREEVAHGA